MSLTPKNTQTHVYIAFPQTKYIIFKNCLSHWHLEETPHTAALAYPLTLTPHWVPKSVTSLHLYKQDSTQHTAVPGSAPGSWWT